MGDEGLLDTLRFWTMSIGDYLDEYFETDYRCHGGQWHHWHRVGGHPGCYVLLHHYMGDVDGSVVPGVCPRRHGRAADALASSFKSLAGRLSAMPTCTG